MQKRPSFFITVTASLLLAWLHTAHAAPDDTLGMAIMSAIVGYDGSLAPGSSGATGVTHDNPGVYVVTFDRAVDPGFPAGSIGCAFAATPYGQDYNINVVRHGASSVTVVTKAFGNFVDTSFYLIAYCAR